MVALGFATLVCGTSGQFYRGIEYVGGVTYGSTFILLNGYGVVGSRSIVGLTIEIYGYFSRRFGQITHRGGCLTTISMFGGGVLMLFGVLRGGLLVFFYAQASMSGVMVTRINVIGRNGPINYGFCATLFGRSFGHEGVNVFSMRIRCVIVRVGGFRGRSAFAFSEGLPLSRGRMVAWVFSLQSLSEWSATSSVSLVALVLFLSAFRGRGLITESLRCIPTDAVFFALSLLEESGLVSRDRRASLMGCFLLATSAVVGASRLSLSSTTDLDS